MKPFLCAFVPLTVLVIGAGYWGGVHSFPIPGNDPLPDWYVRNQELGGRIFETVIFPARWSGSLAIFLGAALWALLPSAFIAYVWQRRQRQATHR
jgi:hypothetical protein